MDRNALAELLQALESRRDAEERRREERYTALIERTVKALLRSCRKGSALSGAPLHCALSVSTKHQHNCTHPGLVTGCLFLFGTVPYYCYPPPQLKNILRQTSLRSNFRPDADTCDINTGNLYKEQGEFVENQDNITVSFNCDGSPVFKSSQYSIWPFLCTMNELTLKDRRSNVVLHTLWFGRQKPRTDTYLTPFVSELQSLHTDGFVWLDKNGQQHTSRVHALICVCDAVARAMVQNSKQFNGTYGCGFCCHEGKVVAKGKGHTRVYPLSAEEPPLRTMAGTIEMAETVVERNNGQAEMGVKGASTLLLLPSFDIIRGFVPDYMHSVCLGVVRQFTNLWFDPKYEEEFHLQPLDLRVIDDEMRNIKPSN
ncbi:UNVERIFIED_CONTAM: hypothetical protein FKN15_045543 [Acipenser sinensis]